MTSTVPKSDGAIRFAVRHSRFVRFMKWFLPMIAVTIILAVMAYMGFYDADDALTMRFTESPSLVNDRQMVLPKFTGTNSRDEAYSIWATAAERMEDNPDEVLLNDLKAALKRQDGSDIEMSAHEGILNLQTQQLMLDGEVTIKADGGYEFRTARVVVESDPRSVTGPGPVAGRGPMGFVRADGFRVWDGGKRIRLNGRVRIEVRPGTLRGESDNAS